MLDTIIRTTIGFVMLLALTRLLGKKQLAQLTVFTYITGIALGSMISEFVMQKEIRFADGLTAVILWSVLVFAVEMVSMKSAAARVMLDGEPSIVIKKGMILESSLKKHRLNLDDLSMQLRLNQVFSIKNVEYAILEPNGALTVIKKDGKNPVTREDMQIASEQAGIPSEIIADGKVVEKNLQELGYSRQQLYSELQKHGIANVKNVFYAELQADRSLHIQQRGH